MNNRMNYFGLPMDPSLNDEDISCFRSEAEDFREAQKIHNPSSNQEEEKDKKNEK